ncbi:MAG: hypothetical protein HOD85_31425 [Deltaproteobacteria bacterium]|nr:hypothetical protein [Deltaproteobacteria bacterium]
MRYLLGQGHRSLSLEHGTWNMDGITSRDHSKIMNSFIWANDDAIKAYRP